MLNAVVYTSNTGFTKQYAELIGKRLSLPVYELNTAMKSLPENSDIVYLGWIMATSIQGLKKASKRFLISAICGVGMGVTGTQIPELRKANAINDIIPVFSLQGGLDDAGLKGTKKFMIKMVRKAVVKGLYENPERSPEDEEMLDFLLKGGSRVQEPNLKAFYDWYRGQSNENSIT